MGLLFFLILISGIVTFSDAAVVERPLKEPTGRGELLSLIDSLRYHGGYPFTSDAFYLLSEKVFTRSQGDRPDVANFVIMITSGLLFSEFSLPLAYEVSDLIEMDDVSPFGYG